MTINQQTLRDLYARVAAGDGKARRDFDRHVLPLLEVVVGRWLSQRHFDVGPPPQPLDLAAEHPSDGAAECRIRRISSAICARLAAQSQAGQSPRSVLKHRPKPPSATSPDVSPAPETIFGD